MMSEILQTWFRSRLGIIIDLSPGIFGRHARDGTLLAKLLHSYDIINDIQLGTITPTQDPALSRVNLRHLKIWLHFVAIDCDDQCIKYISNGKGTAAIQLFYKVFLCLEKKDRLYFITLQKEREKYLPTSEKFSVKIISEEKPLDYPDDNYLAGELVKCASVIEWHKNKYLGLIEDCKRQRDKFRALQNAKESSAPLGIKKHGVVPCKIKTQRDEIADVDEFDRKCRIKKNKQKEYIDFNDASKVPGDCSSLGGPEAARTFVKSLKARKQQEAVVKKTKTQMQMLLLTESWEKLEKEKDKNFNKILASKVLGQSQYEKQMIKKLVDIRNEKMRMSENRRMVERLMQQARENEMRMLDERERQKILWDNYEEEDECRRLEELYQRFIDEEERKKCKEKIHEMVVEDLEEIIDFSVWLAEYKMENDGQVSKIIIDDWKAVFLDIAMSQENFDRQEEEEGLFEDENL